MRARGPSRSRRARGPTTPFFPMASWPEQTVALCRVTTPDAAGWGPPLMYHVGETVTPPSDRERPRGPCRFAPAELSNDRLRAIAEIVRSFPQHLEPTWQGSLGVPVL